MIGCRIASTMKLSGLYSASEEEGSSIRLTGKNALERKRTTNRIGNSPWTMLALPVRSAIAATSEPKATAVAEVMKTSQIAPRTPSSMVAPKIRPMAMNHRATITPSIAVPVSRPSTTTKREMGAAKRRSVKPISMSRASAIAPELPASRTACTIAPASMKARKLSTGGNWGRSTARPAPPVWIASSSVGKMKRGAASWGRRAVCFTERAPRAATTRTFVTSPPLR
jgi:hypothetical protein